MSTPGESSSSGQLLVLSKIVKILDSFSPARPKLTGPEIKASTGLATSTVQRLLANLVSQQMLDRDGSYFQFGPRMVYWGAVARQDQDSTALYQRMIDDLRDETGETVAVHKAAQTHRVCSGLAETHHAVRTASFVGQMLPLPGGSPGLAILAWDRALLDGLELAPDERASLVTRLERIRSSGFAISAGEREAGAAGISAPIFDSNGLWGVLSILGPTMRLTPQRSEELVPRLLSTASLMTQVLNGRRPS